MWGTTTCRLASPCAVARTPELPNARYRAGSNSSIGLPSGSSIWICLPPGPVSISFRKPKSRVLQLGDEARKVGHPEHHPIPPARFLVLPIRHRARTRCAGPTEQNLRVPEGYVRKRGELLVSQREA